MTGAFTAEWIVIARVAAVFGTALVACYGLMLSEARSARWAAWTLLISGVAAVHFFTLNAPGGFRMLAFIAVGLVGMKAVTLAEARLAGEPALAAVRWLAFTLGWAGMNPGVFRGRGTANREAARGLAIKGVRGVFTGAALLAAARLSWEATGSLVLATVLALPGLSLALHFGILNLLAAGWRWVGYRTDALFRAPLLATSLKEFWGRRWNLAFSEMTARTVYRPLASVAGRPAALLAAFAFSGLLHEMAISLPAKAGYGGPMLYFLIHGGLVLAERHLERRGSPLGGWRGRGWTVLALVLPLPILFHPPFLRAVVWPLLGIA